MGNALCNLGQLKMHSRLAQDALGLGDEGLARLALEVAGAAGAGAGELAADDGGPLQVLGARAPQVVALVVGEEVGDDEDEGILVRDLEVGVGAVEVEVDGGRLGDAAGGAVGRGRDADSILRGAAPGEKRDPVANAGERDGGRKGPAELLERHAEILAIADEASAG